jgi:hypothetical protein
MALPPTRPPACVPRALRLLALSGLPLLAACPVTDPCDEDPLGCEAHPDQVLLREADCPAAPPPLAVQLGAGSAPFTAYTDDTPLPFTTGPQGGGHLEVGFSASGLGLGLGRVVEGLRVTLIAEESAAPCAPADEGDTWAVDDAGLSPPPDADAACMRETGSRVILYGPGGVALRGSDAGVLEASGLVLFAGGFLGPSPPVRLRALVEDSCGRHATASHLFTR